MALAEHGGILNRRGWWDLGEGGFTLATFPETPDIETSSDDYARRFSGRVGAWLLKVQQRATLRMLASNPMATVLDVGGGHGQVTRPLIESGFHVTVLGSAESCRRRIESLVADERCSFRVGNILDLPFSDRAFDVVLSYRLLPHVRDWRQLISEMTRVAGKAVIIDYPTVRSVNYFAGAMFGFKKRLEGNTRPFTCFSEPELLRAFQERGFARDGRYAEFLLPMVFHRTLRCPILSAAMEAVCRATGLTHLFGSPVVLRLARKER